MYGHKQIINCLTVVLLVSILNFYRMAIRRDKEIQQTKKKVLLQRSVVNMSKNTIFENKTGHCLEIPFGNFECENICFLCGWYRTWLNKQCFGSRRACSTKNKKNQINKRIV